MKQPDRIPLIRHGEGQYATADGTFVLRIETAFSVCRRAHTMPDGTHCTGATEHPYGYWQLYTGAGAKADNGLLKTFRLTS